MTGVKRPSSSTDNTNNTNGGIKKHVKRKPGVYSCKWKDCCRSFTAQRNLDAHVCTEHTGERPFKCVRDECSEAFVSKQLLIKHGRRAHGDDGGASRFVCTWPGCERAFAVKKSLDTHMCTHTGDMPFPCTFEGCDKRFRSKGVRIQHMRVHTGIKPYKCTVAGCDKSFSQDGTRDRHVLTHVSTNEFICIYKECKKDFKTQENLNRHISRMHENGNKYKCQWPNCTQWFYCATELEYHMNRHAGKKPFICTEDGCNVACADPSSLKSHYQYIHTFRENRFRCDWPTCNFFCGDKDEFDIHFKVHVEGRDVVVCTEETCDLEFLSRCRMLNHRRKVHTNENPMYPCEWPSCSNEYTGMGGLNAHYRSHTGEKPFDCRHERCDLSFVQSGIRNRHECTHNDPSSFGCGLCDKSFSSEEYLKHHIERVHDKIRRCKCDVEGCGRTFYDTQNLKSHSYIHLPERPLSCTFDNCDRGFNRIERLRDHERWVHTGETPFVCTYDGCDCAFSTTSHLYRHTFEHKPKPFPCPHDGCKMAFINKPSLVTHIRVHTGERPYKCNYGNCQRTFKSLSNVIGHRLRHTNDRRFVCSDENCDARFYSADERDRHFNAWHTPGACLRQKKAEQRIATVLDAACIEYERERTIYFVHDPRHCHQFAKIDFMIETDKVIFLLEVDEYQHKGGYGVFCDMARMSRVQAALQMGALSEELFSEKEDLSLLMGGVLDRENEGASCASSATINNNKMDGGGDDNDDNHKMDGSDFGGNDIDDDDFGGGGASISDIRPVVWIRYNPHAFRVDGVLQVYGNKVKRCDRESRLIHLLKTFDPGENPLTILYLFYDVRSVVNEDNGSEIEKKKGKRYVPLITDDPDYNIYMKEFVGDAIIF